MSRKKAYDEEEVIEKALAVFWQFGYKNTTIRMLEKEMGINQFSIYSSFGSKTGVFLESIKLYKRQISKLTNKLRLSSRGVEGIKDYFYDYLKFSKEGTFNSGCFIANSLDEISEPTDPIVYAELKAFAKEIRISFTRCLQQETHLNEDQIPQQVDYFLACLIGLTFSSKLMQESQLKNYIDLAISTSKKSAV